MAKKIQWSVRADQDRIEILAYWTFRNKSTVYSEKLNKLFKEKLEKVAQSPDTGIVTELPDIRAKLVRDYLIYYKITTEYIEVVTIWDSRRNPKKFKL